MGNVVKQYEAMTGRSWSESEGWQFMMAMKLGRIKTKFKEDDVFDLINYTALWMESMITNKKDQETSNVVNKRAALVKSSDAKFFTVFNLDNPADTIPQEIVDMVIAAWKSKLGDAGYISKEAFAERENMRVDDLTKFTEQVVSDDTIKVSKACLPNVERLTPPIALKDPAYKEIVTLWGTAAAESTTFDTLLNNVNALLEDVSFSETNNLLHISVISENALQALKESQCHCGGSLKAALDLAYAAFILRSTENVRLSETDTISEDDYATYIHENITTLIAAMTVIAKHVLK